MMQSNGKRLWRLGITLESVSQGRLSLCPELKKLLVGCKKMRKFEIEMTEAGTYTVQPYVSFPERMSPTLVGKIEYVLNFVSTKGNMGGARISKLLVYREQINDWLKTVAFEGWVVPVYLFGYQVDARYKQRMIDALEIIEEELCAFYVLQEVLFGYSESQFPESKTEDIPNEDSFDPARLKCSREEMDRWKDWVSKKLGIIPERPVLDSATSEAVEQMKGSVRDCEEDLQSIKAASAVAPLKEKSKWQMWIESYECYIDIHELLTRALTRGDASVTLVNRFLDYFSEKTTTLDEVRDPFWYLRSEKQFDITSLFPLDRLESVEAFAEYQAAYTRLYSGRGPSDGRARVVEAAVRLLRQQFVYITDDADLSCLLQLSEEFRWRPHVMLSSRIPVGKIWSIRQRALRRGFDSVHVLPDKE